MPTALHPFCSSHNKSCCCACSRAQNVSKFSTSLANTCQGSIPLQHTSNICACGIVPTIRIPKSWKTGRCACITCRCSDTHTQMIRHHLIGCHNVWTCGIDDTARGLELRRDLRPSCFHALNFANRVFSKCFTIRSTHKKTTLPFRHRLTVATRFHRSVQTKVKDAARAWHLRCAITHNCLLQICASEGNLRECLCRSVTISNAV